MLHFISGVLFCSLLEEPRIQHLANILHYESVPGNIAPGSQTDTFRLGLENLHISIIPVLEALIAAVVL